jgi:hypothetical protein
MDALIDIIGGMNTATQLVIASWCAYAALVITSSMVTR